MKEKIQRSFIVALFEGAFVGIPTSFGRLVDGKIKRVQDKRARICAYLGIGLVSTGLFFGLRLIGNLTGYLQAVGRDLIVTMPFVFYGAYLLLTLPFFLLLAHASKDSGEKLFQGDARKFKKRIFGPEIEKAKAKARAGESYLGTSLWSGKPYYLMDSMRLMHTHVVGSTGVGKTESVLLPLLRRDIETGKGVIILDAKGDLNLLARIRYFTEITGRKKDFLFFSLSHPEISNTYNPLIRGNASEIKDKLIGSTEWREEFYRKKAEEAALTLLRAMKEKGKVATFRTLYHLLSDYPTFKAFRKEVGRGLMSQELRMMEQNFSDHNQKFLSGLIADLGLIAKSEFSRLVDQEKSEIDLLDVYKTNKIVYFSLNTQGYEETAKRFGRLILQDIKAVSNEIQTQMEDDERHFFPVFVDEFSSFVYQNFIEFLNKARGAKFALTLLHQSLADLSVGRMAFQQQVLENTNVKIIMRQDDPFSIDKYAKIGGSKRTYVSTYQTEEKLLGRGFTGVGSIREGQAFRIDPDLVRSLGRGEAIVVTKFPRFYIDYLKLDYAGDFYVGGTLSKIKIEKREALEKIQAEEKRKADEDAFKNLDHTEELFERSKQAS